MNSVEHDSLNKTALLAALANTVPNSFIAVLNRDLVLEFATGSHGCRGLLKSCTGVSLRQALTNYEAAAQQSITDQIEMALQGKASAFDISNHGECEHHSITPIVNNDGDVVKILCFIQNISEQKRSLEALRESEAHLKVATQLAKIGYWELDIDSLIFTFTDQFLDILNVSPDYLGGYQISAQRYAEEFVHEEDRPMVQNETQLAIETNDPNFSRHVEHRFIDGKGRSGYLAVRFFVVKDEHGRTIKTIGANQDITERKLAEQELKKLLEKTTDQNRRLKDFSFMTSHNIRSSVANLVGLSQMIKEDPGNQGYIDMLCTTINKLDNTVKEINTLLNYENALESENKKPCNIQQALEHFIELNAAWIQKENIDIVSRLPANFSIHCVPAYIDSIIHNLVSNAIKYGTTPSAKLIEIGLSQDQDNAIYVRDFGNGLDLSAFGHKIFKPGARFHSDSEGQGMGLYMTKHQIESAGGRIAVESTPGAGTRFTVYFGSEK